MEIFHFAHRLRAYEHLTPLSNDFFVFAVLSLSVHSNTSFVNNEYEAIIIKHIIVYDLCVFPHVYVGVEYSVLLGQTNLIPPNKNSKHQNSVLCEM